MTNAVPNSPPPKNEIAAKPKEQIAVEGLAAFLRARKPRINDIMSKRLDIEKLVTLAVAGAARNPGLLECSMDSFYTALTQCAQVGLYPFTPLKHAHIVPFKNKVTGGKDATFIPGWQGLIKLAVEGEAGIARVIARAVYEGDKFRYTLGIHEVLEHQQDSEMLDDPSAMTHVYAVAHYTNKEIPPLFVVLTRAQCEAIKARSPGAQSGKGPWYDDYVAMCCKSAVIRVCKFVPMSMELATAIQAADKDEGKVTEAQIVTTISGELPVAERAPTKSAAIAAKLEAQRPPQKERPPEDDSDFQTNADGTVTDKLTGETVTATPPPPPKAAKTAAKTDSGVRAASQAEIVTMIEAANAPLDFAPILSLIRSNYGQSPEILTRLLGKIDQRRIELGLDK